MTDRDSIKELKARYFRSLDTKDWDLYRSIFTPDVIVDTTPSGGPRFEGRDVYMDFVTSHIGQLATVHHGHMPEITILSPDHATGIWAMEDWVQFPDGSELNGQGHYHETYVKLDGEWKIRELKLTRLRMRRTPKPAELQ